MPDVYRRVILKPADLTSEAASTLRDQLSAAVEAQQQLASKSLHVLQPVGGLCENDQAFFFEHEPAEPLPVAVLFDVDADRMDAPELMRMAGALFEALRAAHTSEGRGIVHGGVCAGVLVRTTDGIDKVSDFGLAPAICAALGVESYLNVAVTPIGEGPPDIQGTGVWEVLEPDEFERDDRICAFIDPEKYGTQMLDTFEAGSDVISAAFVLHLLAEHRHPYLFNEPDAHRIPEMSEFMAMGRFNGARRKDLRESDDPGVRLWCDLVAKGLSRLPRDRPTSAELADAIGQYVKPPDAGEILARKFDAVAEGVESGAPDEIDWVAVDRESQAIANAEAVSPELVARAKVLCARAKGHVLLKQAQELLVGERWPETGRPLAELRELEGLPEELAREVTPIRQRFERYEGAARGLEEIREGMPAETGNDLYASRDALRTLQARAEGLPAEADLPASLRPAKAELVQTLGQRLDGVNAEIERLEAEAAAYVQQLRTALQAGGWDELSKLLDQPPDLAAWPQTADSEVRECRRRLDQHREEERRRAEIEADHRTAQDWIGKVRAAVEQEEWAKAEKLLDGRPQISHWPEQTLTEANEHQTRVQEARKREADFEAAQAWCAELDKAIAKGQWHVAFEAHRRRPSLEHWPEEVLEKEKLFKARLDEKREEIERDRRITEEQHAKAQAWLEKARTAAERADWEAAVDILDARPDIERWPEGLLNEAQRIANACRVHLGEQLLEQLHERTATVKVLVEDFVGQLVDSRFDSLISRELVRTAIEAEEFTSGAADADGQADMLVRVIDPAGKIEDAGLKTGFAFRLEPAHRGILNDDGSVEARVSQHLEEFLIKVQRKRVQDVIQPLKSGVFPNVTIDAELNEPVPRTAATVAAGGSSSKQPTLQAELAWDPTALAWTFADEPAFTRAAWELAVGSVRRALGTTLFEKSPALKQYQSALTMSVVTEPPSVASAFAQPLTFDLQLALSAGDRTAPESFHTVPVTCPRLGEPPSDLDLSPAESALERVIAAAQTDRRKALTGQLRSRIKAKSPKVKLVTKPPAIAQPVDRISFELRARGHEPLTLEAAWDTEGFEYRPVQDWNGSLEQYLELPVKGGPPVLPLAGAGVVVAIIVAVVAIQLMKEPQPDPDQRRLALTPSSRTPGNESIDPTERRPDDAVRDTTSQTTTPSLNVNTNDASPPESADVNANDTVPPESDNVNANEGPAAPESDNSNLNEAPAIPEPSLDEPIARLGDMLAESVHLAPIADRLVRAGPDTSSASIQYRVPGLMDWLTVVLDPDPDGVTWHVPMDARERIAQEVAELERLLSATPVDAATAFIEGLLGADPIAPSELLDPSIIAIDTAAEPTWQPVSAEDDAWSGNIAAALRFGASPITPVAIGDIALELRDGRVTVVDTRSSVGQPVKQVIQNGLWDIQGNSSSDLLDLVEGGSLRGRVELRSTPIDEPRARFETTVDAEALGLLPRQLVAPWDPRSLEFETEAWQAAIEEIEFSAGVLEWINSRQPGDDDWLSVASSGDVRELKPPDPQGNWLLGVPSDEALPVRLANQPASEIPFATAWRVADETAEQAARRIVSASSKPRYWGLVEVGRSLTSNGPIPRDELRAGFVECLSNAAREPALSEFLDAGGWAGPTLETDTATLQCAQDGASAQLAVSIQSRWGVVGEGVPDLLDADCLATRIAEYSEPQAAVLGVMSLDDGTFDWSLLEGGPALASQLLAALPQLQALNGQIGEWERRARLEQRLETTIQNPDGLQNIDGSGALNLLNGIWASKGAPIASVVNAQTLTEVIGAVYDEFAFGGLWHSGKEGLAPTLFVEYFTGPANVYAVVWSTTARGEFKKAMLLRLCSRDQISSNGGSLGNLLLRRVFDQFPDAVRAEQREYEEQIGVVLAPDQGFEEVGLEQLTFDPVRTRTRPLSAARGGSLRWSDWSSLSDLRDDREFGAYAADYRLAATLANVALEWSGQTVQRPAAVQWAAEVLSACAAAP